MVENKNQHYVPQYYFKQFSSDKKSIYMYNIRSGLCKSVNFKEQCSENYFYSKNSNVERMFSQIENLCSTLLMKIIATESIDTLSSQEMKDLKSYIIFQYGRTKVSADKANETATRFLDIMKPNIVEFSKSIGDNINKEDLDKVKIRLENPVGVRHNNVK